MAPLVLALPSLREPSDLVSCVESSGSTCLHPWVEPFWVVFVLRLVSLVLAGLALLLPGDNRACKPLLYCHCLHASGSKGL